LVRVVIARACVAVDVESTPSPKGEGDRIGARACGRARDRTTGLPDRRGRWRPGGNSQPAPRPRSRLSKREDVHEEEAAAPNSSLLPHGHRRRRLAGAGAVEVGSKGRWSMSTGPVHAWRLAGPSTSTRPVAPGLSGRHRSVDIDYRYRLFPVRGRVIDIESTPRAPGPLALRGPSTESRPLGKISVNNQRFDSDPRRGGPGGRPRRVRVRFSVCLHNSAWRNGIPCDGTEVKSEGL